MSTYEVLFTGGVGPFFAGVALLSGASAFLVGVTSTSLLISIAIISQLWTALLWLVFASYARDIWQMPRVIFTLIFALARTATAYLLRGRKTVFPEWTFRFEMARAAMRALRGGIFAPNVVRSINARYFCHQFELLGKLAGPKSCKFYGTTMETVTANGQEHVWIRDHDHSKPDAAKKERFIVLYYHGGGFVLFAPHFFVSLGNRMRSAMVTRIKELHPEIQDVSIECFLSNYRKSPDHKYPIPQEDALLMFEYVVRTEKIDPSRIILVGDSAGGGLCMSTLLRLKEKGARMPAGAALSCPFVDFAVDEKYDDKHCMLAIELGREMMKAFHPTPEDPATWKESAAVYCDLSGLPPALVQVGSIDTIYSSSIKLYEKAQADGLGASWELDVFPHMPHAFTCLSEALLPDAKRGIDHIADFAVRQFVKRQPRRA